MDEYGVPVCTRGTITEVVLPEACVFAIFGKKLCIGNSDGNAAEFFMPERPTWHIDSDVPVMKGSTMTSPMLVKSDIEDGPSPVPMFTYQVDRGISRKRLPDVMRTMGLSTHEDMEKWLVRDALYHLHEEMERVEKLFAKATWAFMVFRTRNFGWKSHGAKGAEFGAVASNTVAIFGGYNALG